MKFLLMATVAVFVTISTPTLASSVLLTFDDLPGFSQTNQYDDLIPNGYGGLQLTCPVSSDHV